MSKKQRTKYPIVIVEWVDIVTLTGWVEADEKVELPVFETVGYMVYKGKEKIVLCDTKDGVGNVTAFPTGCIVGIKKMGE
jgi:hypothetical protein